MTLQMILSYIFFAMGSLSVCCFLLFSTFYVTRSRNRKKHEAEDKQEMEEAYSLLHSMRKIAEEQKQIAAAFNDDLERKLQTVKQVLGQSLSRNEELYEQQRLLMQEIVSVSSEIKSIRRQIEELDGMIQTEKEPSKHQGFHATKTNKERIPEAPSNPEKAREAFRLLLEEKENEDRKLTESADDLFEGMEMPSLQKRVEELYNDGMELSEIAEKLGIGKGEIQLLLSQRKH